MPGKNPNLMETEEYDRFRRAVQERIDSGELDAEEARRIVESLVRRTHEREQDGG